MANKILTLVFILIMFSCKKNNECNIQYSNFTTIQFKGFNNTIIDRVSFKDLNSLIEYNYIKPKFDSIDVDLKNLNVKEFTSISLDHGFLVTINDSIKYKVSNIKMEEIYLEKKTIWNTKLYGCTLKEYKLNNSLIESHAEIVITK